MGRAPCCDKANVKKGPWAPEEDLKLKEFIDKYGTGGNWIALPQKAGLKRCGKSCRLRWLNYLRPNIKHGEFSEEEDRIICTLFASIGSRWSIIAAQLPGRTDNDIKNYWNTKLKKKLMIGNMALNNNPLNHKKLPQYPPPPPQLPSFYNYNPLIKSLSCLETSLIQPPNPFFHHHNGCDNYDFTPSSVATANAPSSLHLQPQESFLFSAMQQHYYPPLKEGLLVFGSGDQASCSSNTSDGSCSQISSHGKGQIKQEENAGLFGFEENQRFIVDYGNNNGGDPHDQNHMFTTTTPGWSADDHQKYTTTRGYFGNSGGMSPLDYGLEEVKQLITNNSSSSSLFFNDENKTAEEEDEEGGGEKTIYYYY